MTRVIKLLLASITLSSLFSYAEDNTHGSKELTIIGGHENCEVFSEYVSTRNSLEIKPVKWSYKEKMTLPNGRRFSVTHFDYNNDKTLDAVMSYVDASGYLHGSILYVVPNSKSSENKEKVNHSELFVFPCQYDVSKPDSTDCPTFSQNADEAGIEINLGEKAFFRGRYTYLTPLFFNGDTYLKVTSTSRNMSHYVGIIKPKEDTSFVSKCLFKRN